MSEQTFVTINGLTLHYTLDGLPAGIPLVFLNSLGTDLRIWDKIIPFFSDRYLLIRYDQRGHGLSDCPPGPYTLRDHTDDLAGLLAHLQVAEAILIGDSVGGMIALDFAANRPQQVKALILCDTASKIGMAEYWNERIDTLRQHGLPYLAEAILGRWFSPAFVTNHPAEYRRYYHMLTRTPLEGYIATCAAIRDADLSDVVPSIGAPTLVLCGADDGATPPDVVQGLAETLPDARFELIAQAGHIPSLEQPAALATKINQFLSENSDV